MVSAEHAFERRVLWLMGLVQFINIWDFMIVMPLGPDFARALGIDAGHIGWIAGSYSTAAALVGAAAAKFLDRYDRRSVLLTSLTGLTFCTFAMIMAKTLPQLVALRVLTGICGGPMIASSLAVIADVFPEHRRGEAIGKVFGSFSIAAVVGVPLGLEIAQLFGWQMPFIAISAVAALTLVIMRLQLPPMRYHLHKRGPRPSVFRDLLRNPAMLPALAMTATGLFGAFLLIPNLSAHVQQNLGYPRAWLGMLYFCGGAAAFFSMRLTGRISDRIGYARMALYATVLLWITLYIGFYAQWRFVPVLLIFVLFMVASSTRNVTTNALISKIPKPQERAGFMSLVSAVQHLMSGAGAMCATLMLTETPEHLLAGMDQVALISMAMFGVSVWIMVRIERIVEARECDAEVRAELAQV